MRSRARTAAVTANLTAAALVMTLGLASCGSSHHRAVPPTAEHGRGLKIMDAVVDNLRLTGSPDGTTVHFEKVLQYVPGAPGELLLKGSREGRG